MKKDFTHANKNFIFLIQCMLEYVSVRLVVFFCTCVHMCKPVGEWVCAYVCACMCVCVCKGACACACACACV